MGEYAEMMLDGTCCQSCGEYLGSDNGFPTFCPSCADDEIDEFLVANPKIRRAPKVPKTHHADLLSPDKWRMSKNGNIVVGDKNPEVVCLIPTKGQCRKKIAALILDAVKGLQP